MLKCIILSSRTNLNLATPDLGESLGKYIEEQCALRLGVPDRGWSVRRNSSANIGSARHMSREGPQQDSGKTT